MGSEFSQLSGCVTIPDRLLHLSKTCPKKEILIFYDMEGVHRNVLTAQDVYELGGRFGSHLRRQGFQKGDIIANTLPNSPERVITDVGIMMAGCVAMHGQILLADGEDFFQYARNAKWSGVVLTDNQSCAALKQISPYLGRVTSEFTSSMVCDRAPKLSKAIFVTREKGLLYAPLIENLRASMDDIFHCKEISSEDVACIMLTSGSTGLSKLVPRSYGELIAMTESVRNGVRALYPFPDDCVMYNDMLLGWLGGFLLGQLCMGGKRVLTDKWSSSDDHSTTSVEVLWRLLRQENCTFAIPSVSDVNNLQAYLETTADAEAKNYRLPLIWLGGQPIKRKHMKTSLQYLADNMIISYGSSEWNIGAAAFVTKSDLQRTKDNLLGKPFRDFTMRIVDKEGKTVPDGETGEIQIKGDQVFDGYYNKLHPNTPDRNTYFTPDGWFRSSDVGYLDDTGNLYFSGRLNDVIVFGEILIHPIWLEEVYLKHPGISEACIVPIPDPDLHHAICAFIKTKKGHTVTEKDLKDFGEKVFLTEDVVPMPSFFWIQSEDFPLTSTQKLNRKKLREMAAERFGVK